MIMHCTAWEAQVKRAQAQAERLGREEKKSGGFRRRQTLFTSIDCAGDS
jgi:hypothetical protein